MTGILNILAGAISAAIKDTYFNLTTLLLPGDGTNGAQNNTFLDSSSNNFTVTRNGNTTQGTFSPFSQTGWSTNFSSSSFTTSTALFNSGWGTSGASTLTATIDGWIYVNAFGTTPTNVWWNPNVFAKGDNYMCLGVNSSGNIFLYHYDGSARTITSSTTISTNTWVYVAVTITGGTATLYINGTSVGSGTWYGIATAGLTGAVTLGRSPNASGQYWNGYISNFRVSSVARTISTPTSAFTSDGNTSLLTFQSNRFIDNSSNAYTLTVENGTPSIQAFSPFAPTAAYSAATNGGSGYFDGTGDYLSVPDNALFDFGTSNFTMEAWVYHTTAASAVNTYYEHQTGGVIWYRNAAGNLEIAPSGGSVIATSSSVIPVNAWTHIAVARSGTTLQLYINGASVASVTNSTNFTSTNSITIGRNSTTLAFTGYMFGFRVVNGQALASGSFTLPSSPVTAAAVGWTGANAASSLTGTVALLLNFTNAGITDATAKNVLETVGNAQISTTQSKWGGSSMYFDGTGDYLLIPANAMYDMATGDFTYEGWIYPSSVSSTVILFDQWENGLGSWSVGQCQIGVNSSAKFTFSVATAASTSVSLTSTTSISANTWTHFALVRSGTGSGNVKVYINGTADATTLTHTGKVGLSNRTPAIGLELRSTSAYYTGYIDDLRITKGYARYTANFTAPTAAFALQ